MKMFLALAATTAALMSTGASAATMTFARLAPDSYSGTSYTEDGITARSVQGQFWGYPNGGVLHLDPSGYSNAIYDFTFGGGIFNLASLDVSFASSGAIGTFSAYDAADALIGTSSFNASSTGSRTFNLSGITRLRLVDTGNHFSIDNLVLNAAAVPEPATWAMMILGMGAVGYAMRRRIKASEVSFTNKVRAIAAA
jgi:hypothetical protein